jgi:hypothetical protein
MAELVRPAAAVVIPIEVLRLLQHCYICLLVWDVLRDVPHGEDAACSSNNSNSNITPSRSANTHASLSNRPSTAAAVA